LHRRSRFLVLVVALLSASVFAQGAENGVTRRESFALDAAVRAIATYRDATWHWQDVMGVRHSPFAASAARSPDLDYRRWVAKLWRRRATKTRLRAEHVPHASAWLCIHHYEGGWASATGNGYYGGLQMDITFMRHYGAKLLRRKGTADHWSPLEQMWVAERALRSGRGFYPWPRTARACGLI
jgi:Transglycosylase-like domain